MLVKDIIIKACDFIENNEILNMLESEEEVTLSSENQAILDKFVKCFNLIREEIDSEYIPVQKVERVQSLNGKILLSSLECVPVQILKLKDLQGNDVKFDKFNDYILTDKGTFDIYYFAMPNELELDDEFYSELPARVFAYGVVREYYFLQTLYDDAKVWDERFLASIANFARKKGEIIIPRRRWI